MPQFESAARGSLIHRLTAPALVFLAIFATGCDSGGGSDGDDLKLRNTDQAVASNTPLVVQGKWAAYLADEATTGPGTDFNGDGDAIDASTVVLDLARRQQIELGVAGLGLAIVGDQIFTLVDESLDNFDWNDDGVLDGIVLVHWSEESARITYVDDVADVAVPTVSSPERLYYVSPFDPGAGETNLRFVDALDPLSPVLVTNETADARRAGLLGIDEEMVFAFAVESLEGTDLNGDGDTRDPIVLHLLESNDPTASLLNTGLALSSRDVPIRARKTGASDWVVAFPVSETAHGDLTGGGFNDPANFGGSWQPAQCAGREDADLEDDVLHFISFAAWKASPAGNPPVNTGLVARDRIAMPATNPPYIGTLSDEASEGPCDLNQDGDFQDTVIRWVAARTPVTPFTTASQLLAIAEVRGGASGIVELEDAFVIAVDEAAQNEDIDDNGLLDGDLVAWLLPEGGNSAFWIFDHDQGPGVVFVGTDWMAESLDRDFLLNSFSEEIFGAPINTGDNDLFDFVPTWAFIDSSGADLDFAVQRGNAGMQIAQEFAFYRVDERDDNRDWNDDGDRGDLVLFRTNINTGASRFLGTSSDVIGPALEVGDDARGIVGGVQIADESMARRDFNDDGDENDFVVRFLKF